MKNIRLPLRKALAAASILAILPTAIAIACSDGAPTPAPTLQTAPTPTLNSEPSLNPADDPRPTATQFSPPAPTLTPPSYTPAPQPPGLQPPPPPVVGIDTGKGTVFVDPELLAIITKHAAGDDRASGQLRVFLGWDETDIPLNDFLIGQGGVRETDTYNPDFLHANLIWRIPVESMLTVIKHPGVWSAELWEVGQTEQREPPRHPKLEKTANLVVTAWQLGVPAENAAQYAIFVRGDRVLVWIYAENGPDFEEMIAWLESQGIYILDKAKEPTRDGYGKVWHFAHAGDQDGPPCSGGESGLHKYGKQVLCEAVGKVVHLPHKSNREFYGGYHGMLRVSWATPEAPIPGTLRRCDVLLHGAVRRAEGTAGWNTHTRVAVMWVSCYWVDSPDGHWSRE